MKLLPSLRRFHRLLAVCIALAGEAKAVEATPAPPGRVVAVFDGITCEYSLEQEELARLLAGRIAAKNRELAATPAVPPGVAGEAVPLSAAEMRANRAKYLAAICAQLALKKPTAWQEECYDAFLNNYESTMRMYQLFGRAMAEGMGRLDKITLWERTELVRRLEGGEKVTGFTYDPVSRQGAVAFELPEMAGTDGRLAELFAERKQLKHEYLLRITAGEAGTSRYHGKVSNRRKVPAATAASAKADGKPKLQFFPILIPAQLAGQPPAELAASLWEGSTKGGVQAVYDAVQRMIEKLPTLDPAIAQLVLHETTEIGIVDHYYRGKDRRWFCDGVANYVPWRVVWDIHGPGAAQRVYDLPAQLAHYADLRGQADLRKWAAAEHQSEEDQNSRLNRARYAYATHAVMLMNEQAGPETLPRLFAEIGRTKRDKVAFATVEKAWRKIAGTKLDVLLAEAVKAAPPATKKTD